MKNSRIGSGLIMIFVTLVIAGIACTNYTIPEKEKDPDPPPDTTPPVTQNFCEVCHTDYSTLVAVHTPDSGVAVGGCGGDAIHIEPYDRVFMGGDGYDAFKASSHYALGCTGCHNGDSETAVKDSAHAGDFVKHPSLLYEDKCAACHKDITDNFAFSLHNGTGQKRKVAMRSGLSGADEFDQLPAHQIEGYNKNCAQCHGTCGNCHIVRPAVGGGGLSAGHNFNKTPDDFYVCMTCHTSRGKHAFLGVAPGTKPDAHLTVAKYQCQDCHDGHELHGNGEKVEQRYAYNELPQCDDCHEDLEDNDFHDEHMEDFNCQVCHSQDYNNCGSCHIHGEGARIPAYLGFKIAANPLPDLKEGYDLTLVRRTLAAPDNWTEYGVEEYSNFSVHPTYNYTTPHNILKLTERTDVGDGNCWDNCHIRKEGDTLINKELYLFQSDLLEWELEATGDITVDDKLPVWWPTE